MLWLAHHRHAVNSLLFPCWQRWYESDVIVLQDSEAERAQRVVRGQRGAVRKYHGHSFLRREDH